MDENIELRLIEGEFQRVKIENDDVVIINTKSILNMSTIERIKAQLKEYFPNNKILILDGDLKIGAMGK